MGRLKGAGLAGIGRGGGMVLQKGLGLGGTAFKAFIGAAMACSGVGIRGGGMKFFLDENFPKAAADLLEGMDSRTGWFNSATHPGSQSHRWTTPIDSPPAHEFLVAYLSPLSRQLVFHILPERM